MGTDKWLYSAMAGAVMAARPFLKEEEERRFLICPPGAWGRATAPQARDRRKKRKEQKMARRNNRNR